MKRLSEGNKMFISVMAVFVIYALVFVVFEDFDRHGLPFIDLSDVHLIIFALITMAAMAVLLYRYSRRMDDRIRRDQDHNRAEMRRQLTQNISHELKTPVASIMGLTETIINNPQLSDEKRQEFTQRTYDQAQRLSHLLQDLSALNRMDYASQQLEHTAVDLSQLVADIIYESDTACSQRRMTIDNRLPEILVIKGNKQLLYSIFRNLMDNAINYAGDGATVSITATEDTQHWQFSFSDTGQGIPDKHLPHIFERFYRVDKGRSRSMGGTGLGLAIVKNAVLHHGGTINAMKNQAGGLTIEFTLHK